MPEDEILDILDLMVDSIELVQERFRRISTPAGFVSTPEGVTMLDAISMRLQVIGEAVKRIQKLDPVFLNMYPAIKWDNVARFRDFVSHHYEHVDHEIVFDVCNAHIPKILEIIKKMRSDLSKVQKTSHP